MRWSEKTSPTRWTLKGDRGRNREGALKISWGREIHTDRTCQTKWEDLKCTSKKYVTKCKLIYVCSPFRVPIVT